MTPPVELAAVPAAPTDAPPGELDARAKRRAREARRRAKLEAAAARRAARADAKRAELEAKEAPPAPAAEESADDARTDEHRAEDLAAMLSGVVWPVLAFVAGFFGWRLEELTEAEAKRDAASWVPIARRYRWLDLAATWAAAPARLLARVKSKASPKVKPPAAELAAPSAPTDGGARA